MTSEEFNKLFDEATLDFGMVLWTEAMAYKVTSYSSPEVEIQNRSITLEALRGYENIQINQHSCGTFNYLPTGPMLAVLYQAHRQIDRIREFLRNA